MHTIHRTLLFAGFGLLLVLRPADAQSCADNAPLARDVTALFVDPVLGQDPDTGAPVFLISLALNPSISFDLGGASLFFTYDDDALDFREVVFSDFVTDNACFRALNRNDDQTDNGQTAIGLILDPFSCNPTGGSDGSAVVGGGGPVTIATVAYTIVDPSRQAAFVFTNAVSNDAFGQSCRTVGEPFFPQALPVELTSFNALVDGDGALLRWTTASETNNAGFYVEHRRTGDLTWRDVGFVEGAGTHATARQYRHRVEGLDDGEHTFRLRQVDFDGTILHSAEVSLEIAAEEEMTLRVWPNPARHEVHIAFSLPTAGPVRLTLYDVLGREVQQFADTTFASGSHTLPVALNGLAPGFYVIRFVANGRSMSRRIVLAR